MPSKIGEFPCYRIVNTRLDEKDFAALKMAVRSANMTQTALIRCIIKEHLAANAETPVA